MWFKITLMRFKLDNKYAQLTWKVKRKNQFNYMNITTNIQQTSPRIAKETDENTFDIMQSILSLMMAKCAWGYVGTKTSLCT